jgi:hypothetical protein
MPGLISAEDLQALERRIVRMYLDDGEISDVRLLSVDTDDHQDVIYDLIRVVVAGGSTVRGRKQLLSHAEQQMSRELDEVLCSSAALVRQAKPGLSCELKGVHHVKCL